ncbi:Alpha-crystallin domain-containing protein [Actinidia chinensis var. chinensis]|uniref:Alpha-crystallin domain-containing protein n=1 Tax=Actinidia chinensis var. chinensis TaxID=1590841 RepID=A0A2R6QL77_ACTCC|nr:Alpha-crystallin domain-containing protein [Actinidia chinensis var. chinensis]
MASPDRSTQLSGIKRSYSDELILVDTQQPVLDVAPLNTVPYSGPPISTDGSGPSNVSINSQQNKQEMENVLASTKEVMIDGSAATGKLGPTVGLVDIGESKDSYMFRVAIPGVPRDQGDFKCRIEANGTVTIEGVTTTGEKTVHRKYHTFRMTTRNLCPPGRFSVTFQLPGPVDPLQFFGFFGTEGIFEGLIKKKSD